jgi:hypothetical protein
MVRLFLVLGITLAAGSAQVGPTDAQLSERDLNVFRAVMRAGLVPEPGVGDARVKRPGRSVESRTDVPPPAVVSQTLRVCGPRDLVECVPASARYSIQANIVAQADEMEDLAAANTVARIVPAGLILTVPPEHVFRGSRKWSDLWPAWRNNPKVPEAVHFSVPAYINGAAVVYVHRIWRARVYGWLVRLVPDGREWRVVKKTIVWEPSRRIAQ